MADSSRLRAPTRAEYQPSTQATSSTSAASTQAAARPTELVIRATASAPMASNSSNQCMGTVRLGRVGKV